MATFKTLVEAHRVEIAAKIAKHVCYENRKGLKYSQSLGYMKATESTMLKAKKVAYGRSVNVANRLYLLVGV